MARRNFTATNRPQHRNSVVAESVEAGTYRAFITQLAVRNTPSKKTGEDEEKMLIRFRLEGEKIDRTEWFPLSWAALDNPNGDNPALWNLFNDIGYATKAEPAKNAEDGPNIFEIDDEGEEYRAAIGDYKLARPTVLLEIDQRLAKNSFERDTRADERGMLNTITEVCAAPKKTKSKNQKVAAKTAAKATDTIAEEIPF